jgi:LacI family transcriptional regulator
VPNDIGIVHLAVDDDVLDWAGIHSGRRKTGATAVNQLVSLLHNHEYGIPETPLTVLIRGTWQNGRTLRAPARG